MGSGDAALRGAAVWMKCLRLLEVHAPEPANDPAVQVQERIVCDQKNVFRSDVFLIPLRAAVQAMPWAQNEQHI